MKLSKKNEEWRSETPNEILFNLPPPFSWSNIDVVY